MVIMKQNIKHLRGRNHGCVNPFADWRCQLQKIKNCYQLKSEWAGHPSWLQQNLEFPFVTSCKCVHLCPEPSPGFLSAWSLSSINRNSYSGGRWASLSWSQASENPGATVEWFLTQGEQMQPRKLSQLPDCRRPACLLLSPAFIPRPLLRASFLNKPSTDSQALLLPGGPGG